MARILGASLLVALLVLGCAQLPAGTNGPSPSAQASGPGAPSHSLAPPSKSPPATSAPSSPSFAGPPVTLAPATTTALGASFGSLLATAEGFVAYGFGLDASTPVIARTDALASEWQLLDAASAFGAEPLGGIAASTKGWVASQFASRPAGRVGTRLWWSDDGSAWYPLRDQAGIGEAFYGPVAASEWGFAMLGQADDGSGTSAMTLWTSADGIQWRRAETSPDFQPQQLVVLSDRVVGMESQSGTSAMSVDGVTWSMPSPGPAGFDGGDGIGMTSLAAVGDHLIALSTGATGTGVFSGSIGSGKISWTAMGGANLFLGAGVTGLAGGPRGAVALGFDRKTLQPLIWTTSDGLNWARSALPAETFGGGVPSALAVGPERLVALGFSVAEFGAVASRPWSSTDGRTWVAGSPEALGRVPPVSIVCPTADPTGPASLVAMLDAYPLQPEAVWPYCFEDRSLTLDGYVQGCGGCGGISAQTGSPAWLAGEYATFWLGKQASVEAYPPRIGVRVDPALGLTIPKIGSRVRVVGHFDDAASASCRITPNPGWMIPVPAAAATAAVCRQQFAAATISLLTK